MLRRSGVMSPIDTLATKIFADGANVAQIIELRELPHIHGFTSNPTLFKQNGVTDYRAGALEMLEAAAGKSVSVEVIADDLPGMAREARIIAGWAATVPGANLYIKIPVTTTKGESTAPIVAELSAEGLQLNVTGIFTTEQAQTVTDALDTATPSYISVFAGRIADSGRDPLPYMVDTLKIMKARPKSELIWASPRELYNVVQASDIGCHIITVTAGIIGKLPLLGKDLTEYSRETVQMFFNDAQAAGYVID